MPPKQRKAGKGASISADELANHKDDKSVWMAIHGKVYDVTAFQEDHPGGPDVLLDAAGRDATDEFDDIGHSAAALEQMKDYEIGTFEGGSAAGGGGGKAGGSGGGGGGSNFIVPLVLLVLVGAAYFFLNQAQEETA
mmetsp:Transcript_40200/g.111709  ORF Transcript_40200/g.111709 Transcript_40200/m.111709 type:complete len:137 (+) Transcript_40200:151-561(+)